MKRLKRDCDADNHVSSRLAIKNTPKTPQYLQNLVQHGCRTCIEIFFDDPTTKKSTFFRNLIRAKASKEGIKDVIEVHPDILQLRNVQGESLLHVAIQLNRLDIVRMILKMDEESLDQNGPLKYAIDQKQPKVCEFLIRAEILNKFRQSDVESAFMATIRWPLCPGNVFSVLLPKMKRSGLREALNVCIGWDNVEAFKAILQHDKALVNVYGPSLKWDSKRLAATPLHVATWVGRYGFVDFILDNFGEIINLELRDSDGKSAFEIALEFRAPPDTLCKFLAINSELIFEAFTGYWLHGQEKTASILFDFAFREDALEVYSFEDLLKLTAWSFTQPNSVISDKCLRAFYTCEGNSERCLVERAQTILELDEIYLDGYDETEINGRPVLLWLHGQVHKSMIPFSTDGSGFDLVQMLFYTRDVLKHLSKRVYENKQKLTVFLELLSKIHMSKVFRTLGIRIEKFFIPEIMPPKDPKTPIKLQIISDALGKIPWDFTTDFITSILLDRDVDVIKDFLTTGLFQLFMAYTTSFQAQQLFRVYFDLYGYKRQQTQDLLEPFFSIKTRKYLDLHTKPLPLKDLVRLSLSRHMEGIYEKRLDRNDFLDAIGSFKIPTIIMNSLLCMDQTPLKVYHY